MVNIQISTLFVLVFFFYLFIANASAVALSSCTHITSSGTYTLPDNLYANAIGFGACINVTISNIVLECSNYKIINNGTNDQTALSIFAGVDNATIQNCEFDYFNISITGGNSPSNVSLFNILLTGNSSLTIGRGIELNLTGGNFTTVNISSYNRGLSFTQADSVFLNNFFFNNNILSTSSRDLSLTHINNISIYNSIFNNSRVAINSATTNNISLNNMTISTHTPDPTYQSTAGIIIASSSNWTLRNITINAVTDGLRLQSVVVPTMASHDIDEGNLLNGRPTFYKKNIANQSFQLANYSWVVGFNLTNITLYNATNIGQLYVGTSNNVIATNITIMNNTFYTVVSEFSNGNNFTNINATGSEQTIFVGENSNFFGKAFYFINQKGIVLDVLNSSNVTILDVNVVNFSTLGVSSTRSIIFDVDAGGVTNSSIRNVYVNGYGNATRLIDVAYASSNTLENITINNSVATTALIQFNKVGTSNNIFNNINFQNSTAPIYIDSFESTVKVNNTFNNFTIASSDNASFNIFNFTWNMSSSTDDLSPTFLIINQSLISLNASNLTSMNSSATLMLYTPDCTQKVIYVKSGFPQTAADIVQNGVYYTGNYTCANNLITFNVTSWSGYAVNNDTQLPTINITSPLDNTLFGSNTISVDVYFTATDNNEIRSCWWSTDNIHNSTIPSCQSPITINLAGGNTYSLGIYASDTAGNIANSIIQITFASPSSSSTPTQPVTVVSPSEQNQSANETTPVTGAYLAYQILQSQNQLEVVTNIYDGAFRLILAHDSSGVYKGQVAEKVSGGTTLFDLPETGLYSLMFTKSGYSPQSFSFDFTFYNATPGTIQLPTNETANQTTSQIITVTNQTTTLITGSNTTGTTVGRKTDGEQSPITSGSGESAQTSSNNNSVTSVYSLILDIRNRSNVQKNVGDTLNITVLKDGKAYSQAQLIVSVPNGESTMFSTDLNGMMTLLLKFKGNYTITLRDRSGTPLQNVRFEVIEPTRALSQDYLYSYEAILQDPIKKSTLFVSIIFVCLMIVYLYIRARAASLSQSKK